MDQQTDKLPGTTMAALALQAELKAGNWETLSSRRLADGTTLDICRGTDGIWVRVRRAGRGGFVLRAAYSPGLPITVSAADTDGVRQTFKVESSVGSFRVDVETPEPSQPLFRCTTRFTPRADILRPYFPRDLFPLNPSGDDFAREGNVHAAQRGVNAGLLYLSVRDPDFGTVLYFQNLTALNSYFVQTGTKPDGVVGGDWPEFGYEIPTCSTAPLKAGQEITLSDVFLNVSDEMPGDSRHVARRFLDLLAGVYRHLPQPATEYHDWPGLAEQSRHDLETSPKAWVREHGYKYLHPYTDSENPDSMVQLTALLPLREWAKWKSEAFALTDDLRRGIRNFYDIELKTMRRYLPGMKDAAKADVVDSWYLYHPLMNLARLALDGDQEARELFVGSLDYGIDVARHFGYRWPIQFNVKTLDVLEAVRKEGEPGQSDAGGLYAYVCLQAHELTGEERFLVEARNALQATRDYTFDLAYQTNLTAWGAIAGMRLWQLTGEPFYREQSLVFVASFLHNCVLWNSEIDNASRYPTFFGLTALHDGPYMAPYEAFEAFCAFHEYLGRGGDDVPESARLLLGEYCKHALNVGWYFYPAHLPRKILAPEAQVRNAHIDPTLAFPLEDLYADGQAAGQVGQEIYGCGMAFAFVTRAYHRFKTVPVMLFSEYPLYAMAEEPGCLTFRVRGGTGQTGKVRLMSRTDALLLEVTLSADGAPADMGAPTSEGYREFVVSAGAPLTLRWH